MPKYTKHYARFVCYKTIDGQKHRLGLFQALVDAKENERAPQWALQQIGEMYSWFKANLAVPGRFAEGGWKGLGQPGLSWF